MSTFYMDIATTIVPIEETTLADSSTKVRNLNSNVDRVFGSDFEMQLSASDKILHEENVTVPSGSTALSSLVTGLNTTDTVKWLYVKMVSSGEIAVSWFSGADLGLYGKGEFFLTRIGDSQGVETATAGSINFTRATGTPQIDLVVIYE